MRWGLAAFLCWLLAASVAAAQAPVVPVGGANSKNTLDQGTTVGTTSTQIIAAGFYTNAKFLNESTTNFVDCKWGGTPTAGAANGQYRFAPGNSGWIWDAGDPPPINQPLNCISETSTSPSLWRAY